MIPRSPEVSVIIPARDEERNIERAVRSVASQGPVTEVLVADDQSRDGTPEILSQLQMEIPAMRVVRITAVPDGWTGKANAMESAARLASGAWLLFTDADTEHSPGSLEYFLNRAESERADLFSVSPGQRTVTWWEKSVIPAVYTQLARLYPYEAVSEPDSPVVAANGQYMLMRRTAYDRAGGYAAVRSAILDDVEMARRIKATGGRLVFELGAPRVWTRMYDRFGAMWEGWTKGLFPIYRSDPLRVVEAVGELSLPLAVPLLAAAVAILLLTRNHTAIGALVAVIGLAASIFLRRSYARSLSKAGFDSRLARYQMPGTSLLALLLLNSMVAHRLLHRVRWKGRPYSTEHSGPRSPA
ncbi:MAG TPA: glycosyltransferase [Candidatus Acidoferrales bacterium]|nr:glycosyltransferase [Candidatus Acidoferrales bacterium]